MGSLSLQEQVNYLNQMLRGHYPYYGSARNIRALQRVHRAVEGYWRRMLSSLSWKGTVWWAQFQRIEEQFPQLQPKLHSLTGSCKLSPYCESPSEERSAASPHARFCGSRRWATAPGHPVAISEGRPYRDSCSRSVEAGRQFMAAPARRLGLIVRSRPFQCAWAIRLQRAQDSACFQGVSRLFSHSTFLPAWVLQEQD